MKSTPFPCSDNPVHQKGWAKTSLVWIVCAILFIWVIPNTIALRNSLLVLGALNSIYIIFSDRNLFVEFGRCWIPLLLLVLLYFWAIIHYLFFSLDPTLELSELKSLWLRSFAGSLIAIAIPLCFYEHERLRKYFFLFLFSTPVINIVLYIAACFNSGHIITPQEYVVNFAFKKIETVFFGSIATAVAAAKVADLLSRNYAFNQKNLTSVVLWILGIVICFISAVVSNTKNGILIPLFIVILLSGYLLVTTLQRKSNRKVGLLLLLGLLLFSLFAWKMHAHFSTGGWNTLLADFKVAVDVENQRAWKTDNPEYILPLNEQGQKVSGSTYMRVAWAVVGMQLIGRHPLGYGSINGSYNGLLELEGIDPGKHGQTHSGWVDFGLAYGIPGLTLLLSVLILAPLFAPKSNAFNDLQIFFISITFLPLSLIAETAWKQYFEATLFFVTYALALLIIKKFQN